MSSDHSGRVLHGTYRLVRKIGEGSMGSVYEAQHSRLPKQFAVKMIAGEAATKREALSRFRREAEITSRLGHPNIVEVIDFNQTDKGEPYLVMELLAGEDLASYIRRVGGLELAQVKTMMGQITSAIDAAHKGGVVHRDLKPHNIFLVGEERRIKVVDFGISKIQGQSSSLTRDESIIGTPHYMAPEQIAGDATKVDWRADIYAIGAILYEMLCGKPPYFGATLLSVLYKVVHEQPIAVSKVRAGLPSGIDKVIAHAMARDRERRYRRASDMMRQLDELLVETIPPRSSKGLDAGATEPAALEHQDTPEHPMYSVLTAPTRQGERGDKTGPMSHQAAAIAMTLPPPGIGDAPTPPALGKVPTPALEQQITAVAPMPLRPPQHDVVIPSTRVPAEPDAAAQAAPMSAVSTDSMLTDALPQQTTDQLPQQTADVSPPQAKPISTLSHSSGELRQLIVEPPDSPRSSRLPLIVGVSVAVLLTAAGILIYSIIGPEPAVEYNARKLSAKAPPNASTLGRRGTAADTGASNAGASTGSASNSGDGGAAVGSAREGSAKGATIAVATERRDGADAQLAKARAKARSSTGARAARAKRRRAARVAAARRRRAAAAAAARRARARKPARVRFFVNCRGVYWYSAKLWVDGVPRKKRTAVTLTPGWHRVKVWARCKDKTYTRTQRIHVKPGQVIKRKDIEATRRP